MGTLHRLIGIPLLRRGWIPAILVLLLPAIASAQTIGVDPYVATDGQTGRDSEMMLDELDEGERIFNWDEKPFEPESYVPQYGPELICEQSPRRPRETGLTVDWLEGRGDDLGMRAFDVYSMFAVGESGLLITAGGGINLVDGPTTTDLPPRLYNMFIDFLWQKQLSDRLDVELGITPTYYTDFRETKDAFRILAQATGYFHLTDTTQLVFGAMYVNVGDDVPLLPVAGIIWTPREDLYFEIVFPELTIGKRIEHCECRERWIYLKSEFSGGSWAIERAGGASDVANYFDWRLMAVVETRYAKGCGWRVEAGYVFDRELNYDSGLGDFEPNDTLMVRIGSWF